MLSFLEFFTQATTNTPYGYQARLARDGLPEVLQAPTGSGKTGVILAWLWRRLYGQNPAATPRRLVYALPQRSLVEQVAGEVATWLRRLNLETLVPLHVVMGGAGETQRQWRLDMHRPAIVVGTVDSLVSKALNRGYGISRATYPIDFALVTNGAHWIIDEIQLCPESTTTLRQLAGLARMLGTAEPFGLTCMSATVPETLLDTVDNPVPVRDVVRIEPDDRVGELRQRLDAQRTVRRLAAKPGDHKAIAVAVRERHRPGTLTLVVVNQVEVARSIHAALRGGPAPVVLAHSRFRGGDRKRLIGKITADLEPAGRIVVATQVVEAGIDLDAAVLVTEAAPWSSVVQRAGRCNRAGRVADAELWWIPPAKALPYPDADVKATCAELEALEGVRVTGESLLAREVATTEPEVSVLRKPDLLALFDTAPDLDGADLDVAPYVRDAEDLDVQLAWATWTPSQDKDRPNGAPPDDARAPEAEWRCRVPLGGVAALLKRSVPVWRFDQALGSWTQLKTKAPARPGEVLVVHARDGGYDPESGFDADLKRPVADSPELTGRTDPATGAEDAYRDDAASVDQSAWLSLTAHSEQTRDHAQALLDVLRPGFPRTVVADTVTAAVTTAAYLHDVGKSHPIWQDALCELAPRELREQIEADRPWAKSAGSRARLTFAGGARFRHELASLLLLDGPLRDLMSEVGEVDLVRYLVLAHHGKLRVQVREPGDPDPDVLLGLRQGDTTRIPAVLGLPEGDLTVDLAPLSLGGDRSWTRTALALRDRYGPFVLAYLETVVRIADWRASAGLPPAGPAESTDHPSHAQESPRMEALS